MQFTDIKKIVIKEQKEVRKIVGFTFEVERVPFVEDVHTDPLCKVSKEEIYRISQVAEIELTEDQAEQLTSTVIRTIAENDLNVDFYDYIKQLKKTEVIWSVI